MVSYGLKLIQFTGLRSPSEGHIVATLMPLGAALEVTASVCATTGLLS